MECSQRLRSPERSPELPELRFRHARVGEVEVDQAAVPLDEVAESSAVLLRELGEPVFHAPSCLRFLVAVLLVLQLRPGEVDVLELPAFRHDLKEPVHAARADRGPGNADFFQAGSGLQVIAELAERLVVQANIDQGEP